MLIEDVTDGLIRMMEIDGAVGQSFNLVGEPMMSARDYFDAIHKNLGARINVRPSSLMGFYVSDFFKSNIKRYALRRHGVTRASLRDWKSRAHYSRFRNDHAKAVLGWKPETDKDAFIHHAIVKPRLFGF